MLGFDFVKEFEVDPDDAGILRILLLHQHSGFLLGLCNPAGRTGDAFDPLRTGLDHVAYEVADCTELDSWIARLDHRALRRMDVRDVRWGLRPPSGTWMAPSEVSPERRG